MQVINTYIHFPEKLDDYIDSIDSGRNLIKEFQMIIDLADCEKNSVLFYSKSNKDLFFENIDVFEEYFGYFGGIDFKTVIEILFQEAQIHPINEEHQTKCIYSVYTSNSTYLERNFPILFQETITTFKNLNKPDKIIILNLFNNYFSKESISIIEDCGQKGKQIIDLPFVENFKQLDEWLINNRIPRNYNMGDNRHIESHPESQINSHKKSPLIGGLGGKENAKKLLKNAIGDKKFTKDLINCDTTNNDAYIWFEDENENPQNQYHGYHLVKAGTYEEDRTAVKNIPERVISIIDYRKII